MYHFKELNSNIENVPMKFSDKYLNLLQNSMFEDSCDEEDIEQYQISDYKFDSELIAIEIYELYQKRKEEKLRKKEHMENKETNAQENAKSMRSKILPNNQKSNLFYNMISGEILQPQPLNNIYSPSSPQVSVSVNPNCDNKNLFDLKGHKNMLVNPKEFENDDSSPFDNVELQTIDDIKELNKVFGALNLNTERNSNLSVPRNSPIQNIDDAINANHLATFPSTTNHYHGFPTTIYTSPQIATNYETQNSYSNYKTTNHMIYDSFSTLYSQYHSPNHILPDSHNLQPGNNMSLNTFYNSSANIYNYNHNLAYPSMSPNFHMMLEMRRSSSEKKDFYNPIAPVSNIMNSRSKSVSDLSKIPESCDLNKLKNDSRALNDRSRTPPTFPGKCDGKLIGSSTKLNNQKNLIPTDPYESLTEEQRKFVDRFCQMGFQRGRVSRSVKHMDINDDKKILEYLLTLQQLEDQGYNCYEVEMALHFNNYNKNDAENFLKTLRQMCDFGFDKEKSIKALFKTNNDRDKAIELLLKTH